MHQCLRILSVTYMNQRLIVTPLYINTGFYCFILFYCTTLCESQTAGRGVLWTARSTGSSLTGYWELTYGLQWTGITLWVTDDQNDMLITTPGQLELDWLYHPSLPMTAYRKEKMQLNHSSNCLMPVLMAASPGVLPQKPVRPECLQKIPVLHKLL